MDSELTVSVDSELTVSVDSELTILQLSRNALIHFIRRYLAIISHFVVPFIVMPL